MPMVTKIKLLDGTEVEYRSDKFNVMHNNEFYIAKSQFSNDIDKIPIGSILFIMIREVDDQ